MGSQPSCRAVVVYTAARLVLSNEEFTNSNEKTKTKKRMIHILCQLNAQTERASSHFAHTHKV